MNPPSPPTDDLAERCARAGLMPNYLDVRGVEHTVPPASLLAILKALQAPPEREGDPDDGPGVSSSHRSSDEPSVRTADDLEGGACHLPQALRRGERIWGLAVQLYGLRSARNWGIGDFSDLSHLAGQWAADGADIIGLNPLHALSPRHLSVASPYSPSSRLHLNWLYLDVERVVGFDTSEVVQSRFASDAFQQALQALRSADRVDYLGVAARKGEILRLLHVNFRTLPRDSTRDSTPDSNDAAAFQSFRQSRGASLRRHAIFEALQATFAVTHPEAASWRDWPEAFRSPDTEAVERFVADHETEVEYAEFVEWQASVQLSEAQARCRACGMAVGLYLDMAVSVDPDGSDVWAHQAVYAAGVQIGAPPDEGNPAGQDWGLCPLRPDALRRSDHDLFRRTLIASMRFAGALRIDHVMGLMRLYLIPRGASPRDGAYLLYPYQDLLDIVAEESRSYGCMVIGEDLGTVDPAMQQAMRKQQVLSYKVLYFEQSEEEGFRHPDTYPSLALATVSTHDLPTLAGWWSERDLDLRDALGLFPDPSIGLAQREGRRRDRRRLIEALVRSGQLPPDTEPSALADAPLPQALAHEIQIFVASGAAQVVMIQMEDVHGLHDQANMPGTTREHPNWCRKLPAAIDDPRPDAAAQDLAAKTSQARRRNGVVRPVAERGE